MKTQLNHSRNLSTSYKRDNYYYDIERSKATAKQIKFYQSLWYMFKDNDIDLNTELDKRKIPHSLVQDPSGRSGYSVAINYMTEILTDLGLYKTKNNRSKDFQPYYCYQSDGNGAYKRKWQEIKHVGDKEE